MGKIVAAEEEIKLLEGRMGEFITSWQEAVQETEKRRNQKIQVDTDLKQKEEDMIELEGKYANHENEYISLRNKESKFRNHKVDCPEKHDLNIIPPADKSTQCDMCLKNNHVMMF